MRRATVAMMVAGGLICLAAAAAAEAASGSIGYRATATFSDGTSADRLYAVTLDADSDGDGVGDEAYLRVACSGGAITGAQAYSVKSPRDVATGQSSGKRMHKPFTITKELDRSAAGSAGKVQWDLAVGKGARTGGWDIKSNTKRTAADGKTMALDDWQDVVVTRGMTDLCS